MILLDYETHKILEIPEMVCNYILGFILFIYSLRKCKGVNKYEEEYKDGQMSCAGANKRS